MVRDMSLHFRSSYHIEHSRRQGTLPTGAATTVTDATVEAATTTSDGGSDDAGSDDGGGIVYSDGDASDTSWDVMEDRSGQNLLSKDWLNRPTDDVDLSAHALAGEAFLAPFHHN